MSSSESVELKRKSASNASCNSCEVLCNSRVFLRPSNGEIGPLNSTSSYSCASDCLQSGASGLILPGARRLQKTVSLEEIYSRKKQKKSKSEQRRKSELPETDGLSRKNSARKLRKKSSQRRPSKVHDIERGSAEASPPGSRLNSESQSGKGGLRRQQSKDNQWRQQRRKRIIKAILGVYIFLLFISILSVVVTLTHTSTATVLHNNSTKNLTYYTFSPSPGVPQPDKT